MAINLATKYESQLATIFTKKSITDGKMNTDYSWNGVASINILTPTMPELADYTRSGANRYGSPEELQDTKQTIAITQDKGFTFTVDEGNNTQQQMAKRAGILTKAEIEEKVVPFWDKYRLSQWATKGKQNTITAVDKDTVLDMFIAARKAMVNANVPMSGEVFAYVPATTYAALLRNPEFISVEKLGEKDLSNGVVGKCMGFKVVETPDEYVPEKTQGLFVSPKAVVGPMQLSKYKVHKDAPGIGGDLYEGRYLGDADVVTAYADGVQLFLTA